MRVLCVSPLFPPVRDSEAFCGGKMALALKQHGLDVTTVYLKAAFLSKRFDNSALWEGLRSNSVPLGQEERQDRLKAVSSMVLYRTMVWPRWISEVIEKAVRLHQESPFDLVYSRSLPMFSHIAGYWTARKIKRPWIANINDPWDEHLFPGLNRRGKSPFHSAISNYWLRKTFQCADAVTFPCRRLGEYTGRFVRNGRECESIAHVGHSLPIPHLREFRVTHAGKLGANEITGRSTRALLGGFKKFLQKVPGAAALTRLVLVGPEDPASARIIAELGLDSIVESVGQVTYEESLVHIARASVCVLIEANMREGIFLPSKLADYLVARKPVLALSPPVGTLADLSSHRGIIRVDHDDESGVEKALRTHFEAHQQDRISEHVPSTELVSQFTPEYVADQFVQLALRVGVQPREIKSDLVCPPQSQDCHCGVGSRVFVPPLSE